MKIISGFLRGVVIPTVKNAKYRPTTGKFKEALFSILNSGEFADNSPFKDKEILDLFAGSCALGFEALSRGAKHATFIDSSRENLDIAKIFARRNKLESSVTFLNIDATQLRKSPKKYDVVFIDPPYKENLADKALILLHKASLLNINSLVIVEIGLYDKLSIETPYEMYLERKYGASKLMILKYIGKSE